MSCPFDIKAICAIVKKITINKKMEDYKIHVTGTCSIYEYVGFCSFDVEKVRLSDLIGVELDLLVS